MFCKYRTENWLENDCRSLIESTTRKLIDKFNSYERWEYGLCTKPCISFKNISMSRINNTSANQQTKKGFVNTKTNKHVVRMNYHQKRIVQFSRNGPVYIYDVYN